jgi:hypothetical protein
MSESKPKTFKEASISGDLRRSIVNALKEEGFSEEQLNVMEPDRVWKLYIDSFRETFSREFSEFAKACERYPELALMSAPLMKELTHQLKDSLDKLEKELAEKEKKEKGQKEYPKGGRKPQ